VLAVVGLLLTALMLAPNAALAQAQGVRGEASITTTGGYGRIVIRTAADVESQVRMTSGILVIQFRQPVNVAFAGPDKKTLYVLGAVLGLRDADSQPEFGSVYKIPMLAEGYKGRAK